MPAEKIKNILNSKNNNRILCTDCVLHEVQRKIPVPVGRTPCDILIIGEYPTSTDGILGKALSGENKKLLTYLWEKSRLSEFTYCYTNILRCIPTDKKGGAIRTPGLKEIATCKKYVLKTINESHAKVFILIGDLSKKYLQRIVPNHFYIQSLNLIVTTGGIQSPFFLQNLRTLECVYEKITGK